MIYAIGAIAVVIALLLGTVKVQSLVADKYKAEASAATSANKQLADDCTAKITGLTAQVKALGTAGAKKQKDAKAAAAAADAKAAEQGKTIAALSDQARNAKDAQTNCAAATATLDQLAKDRSK